MHLSMMGHCYKDDTVDAFWPPEGALSPWGSLAATRNPSDPPEFLMASAPCRCHCDGVCGCGLLTLEGTPEVD
jgi:hypothetical protein